MDKLVWWGVDDLITSPLQSAIPSLESGTSCEQFSADPAHWAIIPLTWQPPELPKVSATSIWTISSCMQLESSIKRSFCSRHDISSCSTDCSTDARPAPPTAPPMRNLLHRLLHRLAFPATMPTLTIPDSLSMSSKSCRRRIGQL